MFLMDKKSQWSSKSVITKWRSCGGIIARQSKMISVKFAVFLSDALLEVNCSGVVHVHANCFSAVLKQIVFKEN